LCFFRPDEQGLGKELINAVSTVANAIGKDSQKLRSDLVKKLQEQRNRSYEGQKVEDKSSVRYGYFKYHTSSKTMNY